MFNVGALFVTAIQLKHKNAPDIILFEELEAIKEAISVLHPFKVN